MPVTRQDIITTTTVNSVPRINSSGILIDGLIKDDGSGIGINSAPVSGVKFKLKGANFDNSTTTLLITDSNDINRLSMLDSGFLTLSGKLGINKNASGFYDIETLNTVKFGGNVLLGNNLLFNGSGFSQIYSDPSFNLFYSAAAFHSFDKMTSIGNTSPVSLLSAYSTRTATSKGSDIDCLNLGGQYSNSAGANLKVKIYDDGGTVIGLGVSSGQFDIQSGSTSIKTSFYNGSTLAMSIYNGDVGVNNANPSAKLHVVADSASSFGFISTGKTRMADLPTSNSGLTTGDFYVDTAANILSNGDKVVGWKV